MPDAGCRSVFFNSACPLTVLGLAFKMMNKMKTIWLEMCMLILPMYIKKKTTTTTKRCLKHNLFLASGKT